MSLLDVDRLVIAGLVAGLADKQTRKSDLRLVEGDAGLLSADDSTQCSSQSPPSA